MRSMAIPGSIGDVLQSGVPDDPDPDVALEEFFDEGFMEEHTGFDSFEEFVAESPWEIEGGEDLERVPSAELDRFVRRTTQFDDLVAMRNRAARREVQERLFF